MKKVIEIENICEDGITIKKISIIMFDDHIHNVVVNYSNDEYEFSTIMDKSEEKVKRI